MTQPTDFVRFPAIEEEGSDSEEANLNPRTSTPKNTGAIPKMRAPVKTHQTVAVQTSDEELPIIRQTPGAGVPSIRKSIRKSLFEPSPLEKSFLEREAQNLPFLSSHSRKLSRGYSADEDSTPIRRPYRVVPVSHSPRQQDPVFTTPTRTSDLAFTPEELSPGLKERSLSAPDLSVPLRKRPGVQLTDAEAALFAYDPEIGEYVAPQQSMGTTDKPYDAPNIPYPMPDNAYRLYVMDKQRKGRTSGLLSRYDDYGQSIPGLGQTFGTEGPDGRKVYPDPTHSRLGESDLDYTRHHPSEEHLERVPETGSRAVFGSHLRRPIHGPVEAEYYYRGWADIGQQYERSGAQLRRPLPQEEEDFLREKGFEFITDLGSGGYGAVWSVNATQLFRGPNGGYVGKSVACKVLNITTFGKGGERLFVAVTKLTREADLHMSLRHPNIVECYHVYYIHDPETGFPYCRCLMFMDLCDGDLKSLIGSQTDGHFDERQAFEMFLQVSDAIMYLHDQNVCHLDLKIHNVLYIALPNRQIRYKLADFGLSKRFGAGTVGTQYGPAGTRLYYPPEVLCIPKATVETKPIDIYCLGLLLAECLSGRARFKRMLKDLRIWTTAVHVQWGVDQICADLLTRMTDTNPAARPTIHQVRQHQWCTI